ncbi:hypothetical protein K2173_018854 [Erythroxylum novogranatense]|uniref:DUF7787 domain-containing protein n=1 Tax=Erythroxylum novogranatense TaxID=1862640 RepID=A0AAV8SB12_9ROSI|nr:hypothetical protein K2173_018854 [Erythroxylum novogranatense]
MKGGLTLSLEDYFNFFHSQNPSALTVTCLNQIIFMHGFKKIYKLPKKALSDALETIGLVNPSRSTLQDNEISPCAFMTVEDVTADLEELNWQECCITSIQSFNSAHDHSFSSSTTDGASSLKPAERKRKRGGPAANGHS